MGSPPKEGIKAKEGSKSAWCKWIAQSKQNDYEVELSIDVLDQQRFDDAGHAPGFEAVPGLGEAAYHGSVMGQVLWIKQNGLLINMLIHSIQPTEKVVAAEVPLAKALLARL